MCHTLNVIVIMFNVSKWICSTKAKNEVYRATPYEMDSAICESVFKRDIITENDIKTIINKCGYPGENVCLINYNIYNASDKMLGFLGDYWKLKIEIRTKNNNRETLNFFIKSKSTNAAKAEMVEDMKLFEKEIFFYDDIKTNINIPGIKPWCATLIFSSEDSLVFEDLNAVNYSCNNKFETFDEKHTHLALEAIARFHASCIIYEENRSKHLGKVYSLNDDYEQYLNKGGYEMSDPWYSQCMAGALATIKSYSKYSHNKETLGIIESRWKSIWNAALDLSDFSSKLRNVICHRDLWNNNILFKYKNVGGKLTPDNCLLVDFQAARCQPPGGDVMLLLYCNLEKNFRENNISKFLNYYYNALDDILENNGVAISDVLPLQDFLKSCEQQRLWGLIISACLVPQFWIDDDLTTEIFCDRAQFEEIMTKDKAKFIKAMIEKNEDYKIKVLQVFEEIVERYCQITK